MGKSIWVWKCSKMRASRGPRFGSGSSKDTTFGCSVSFGQFKYQFSFRKWQV